MDRILVYHKIFKLGVVEPRQVKEIKFNIDENKLITMSSTFKREDLIFAKDGVYYIDRLNKTLSLIKGGEQINSILDFFLSFEGYDIEKNEEFFLKYIYKGNEELIFKID